MPIISPVWQEWLSTAILLGTGIVCLRAGTWSSHRSAPCRTAAVVAGIILALAAAAPPFPPFPDGPRPAPCRPAAVVAGIILALAAAAAHYPPFRDVAGPWLTLPGGEGVLACLGAAVLLGVAWSERKRHSSRLVLVSATSLVFLLLT